MAPLYVRGLLGSGGRKSVQPMAERLGLASHDPLHHFISSRAWDDAPLWRVLAEQVDQEVGGAGAVLVVDDSGLPKKGAVSVGVARQYCGELGKVANSQVLVSLTLARGAVPLPVGLRLFLPAAWTDDAERCEAAGVPAAARPAQSKPAIALAEIDRVREAGLRFSVCWPMPGSAAAPSSATGSTRAGWPGRLASPAPSLSIRPPSNCVRHTRRPDGQPNIRCPTGRRARPPRCWRRGVGVASPGATAPRARSMPASPPCGCAWRMGRSTSRASACRARSSG